MLAPSLRRTVRLLPMLISSGLLLAACLAPPPGVESRRDERLSESPLNDWFLMQRLSVDPLIPVERRHQEALRMQRADANAPGQWLNVGPTNIGGRVSSIAIGQDSLGHELFWLGAAAGGVFSSTDGKNWSPRFDSQTALSIGAIAVHPTQKQTVFVGTGEEDLTSASYDGEGLFKTTDAGSTWSYLGLAETHRIAKIAIDKNNPNKIFIAAGGALYFKDQNRGLYRTQDGGANWTKVLYGDIDAGVIDVAIDPSNSNRIFAAIWQHSRSSNNTYWGGTKSGLYRSIDGGTTWIKLTSGLPSGSIGRIGIAIAPSSPSTVYITMRHTSGSWQGTYKSTNSGDTWTKVDSATFGFQLASYGWWFGPIRVDPTNANIVYVLDLNIWRSTDGGKNYTSISGPIHVDQHELIVETGRLISGNDGGFFISTNGGGSWTPFTALPTSQFYDICTDQVDPRRRFGGLQDNNTVRTTSGNSNDWTAVLGGDGMECEVDPSNSNYVYAEAQNGDINRSENGGDSFSSAQNGIDGAENRNWVTPIRIDATRPNYIYMGAQKVYQSTDRALNWHAISPDLTSSSLPSGNPIRGTITAIGISRVDHDVIWAGTDNGNLWVSENGGTSWTQVNPTADTYWYTEVAPDPFDRRTAYVTISGYKLGSNLPYIRKTTDLGATWIDITPGLPQVPLNSVLPDLSYRGRLFVASDLGVHVSADGGTTWEPLGSGMPFIVVHDLALNENEWKLYAGTHSRSIYGYDLRQLPQDDFDGDGDGNLDDCARNDATIGHGVPERNDGIDNQCPGDPNFGIIDEISGDAGFHTASDKTLYSWPAQTGATGYEVARSSSPRFDAGCSRFSSSASSTSDPQLPPNGSGFFYLVRATAPHQGSWGRRSNGQERLAVCP